MFLSLLPKEDPRGPYSYIFHRMNLYDFSARSVAGDETSLDTFRGRVCLIVNVASGCGYTPQYAGLERLYQKHKADGFEVLAFPCNQFGAQEPASNLTILEFCSAKYGVSFPLFAKVDVNGPDAHPLFAHLKSEQPGLLGTEGIKWNFTKFLVARDGTVSARFAPNVAPEQLEGQITSLLAEPVPTYAR